MDTRSNGIKRALFICADILINLLIACGIIWTVSRSAILFTGSDSMYHVYRGDWILKSIEAGDAWPLYNPVWYNGVELMRYWPPAAAYLMAFCQFIARSLTSIFTESYVFEGFAVYSGIIYLLGAITWNIAGSIKKRPVLGAIFGVLWFFMPQSLHVLFGEGNLPRSLIMAIFPLAFVFINDYLKNGRARNFVGIAITFFAMCACHVGYSGMVVIACVIYLVVYRLCCFSGSKRLQRSEKRDLEVMAAIVAGFLLSGIFTLPALKGGLASNTSNAAQAGLNFFQSVFKTLSPVEKLRGGYGASYFGLVSFLLAVLGIIAGKRRSRAGFITAVIIVLLTAKTAGPIIQSLPGGSLMWMLRFLQIASAMIFYSMLEWDSIKKPVIAFIIPLLVLDCAVALYTFKPGDKVLTTAERFDAIADETLIDEAKSITNNRIALMDSNSVIGNGVFYLTDYNGSVDQLFGQGWEAASTSLQIAQINESFDTGYYYFMFDRLLEYGCDTILIKKDAAAVIPYDEEKADEAAAARGYVKEFDEGTCVVFHHKDVTGKYGTVSNYDAIAIGNGAYYISMMFPSVAEAPSEYVDDFTLEELKNYKIVFLDGFKYHDVHAAEELVTKASQAGVKIYVLADGIPENAESRTFRFLGVECQSIEFDNGFPTLFTNKLGNFEAALFPDEYRKWKTVYMNGLSKIEGWSEVLGETLPFYGTGENENLVFVGFNLTYYFSITKDENIGALLSGISNITTDTIPERKIVPIGIEYGKDRITVNSPEDNVNTSLASHDIFNGNFRNRNHLIYVDKGTTEITMHYPYPVPSALMSVAGIVLTAGYAIFIGLRRKNGDSPE